MFQIKDFSSICAAEINRLRATQDKVTDFNIGSVARALVEAPAVEMDELYQQMLNGLTEAIPVSVFNSFDFTPLPAQAANGLVTFYASPAPAADVLIPANTAVRAPSGTVKYYTQVDVTLEAGDGSVSIQVFADTAGYVSNAPAGTITELIGTINGITSVSNTVDFTNGRDEETEAERKVRFQGYISTLPRGTKAAIVYGVKTAFLTDAGGQVIERVVDALPVEPYLTDPAQPVALVNLYIYNGSTGASSSLVARAQQIVDGYHEDDGTAVPGYKAAGVIVNVQAVSLVEVDVTGTLALETGYVEADVIAAATAAVENYLQALPIGQPAILAEIIRIIMETAGVYDVTLSAPADNVAITSPEQKIVPGTVALTVP